MKKIFRILVCCLTLTLVFTSFFSGIVQADEEDYSNHEARLALYDRLLKADNPEKFFSELSPEAQNAIIEMMKPGKSVIKTIDLGIKTSGRTAICVLLEQYSAEGIHLYDYSQTIDWA
jgi:hypothetical protein